MVRRFRTICLLGLAVILLGLAAWSQQNPQHLVLKDGSFQSVTKWEVKGDRVRYYSADRYTWEELPNDLVDWPATEKFNRDRLTQRATEAGQLIRMDEADREADNVRSPLIAPGLRLPDGGGVFVLDDFHAEPQLVELVQNGGELNRQMGKNILRAAINPLALSSKQTIELKGPHSHVQTHIAQPAIYVNVATTDDVAQAIVAKDQPKSEAPPAERYRIVRMERKKDVRVVGNLNIGLTGHITQKASWIAATSTQVGDWTKLTPNEPLVPGEYAVVEMLDQKQVNLFVWDFGFDPDAPANASTWTARKPVPQNTAPPALEKRPK